eukprot:3940473-Rhodomonas_salina.1
MTFSTRGADLSTWSRWPGRGTATLWTSTSRTWTLWTSTSRTWTLWTSTSRTWTLWTSTSRTWTLWTSTSLTWSGPCRCGRRCSASARKALGGGSRLILMEGEAVASPSWTPSKHPNLAAIRREESPPPPPDSLCSVSVETQLQACGARAFLPLLPSSSPHAPLAAPPSPSLSLLSPLSSLLSPLSSLLSPPPPPHASSSSCCLFLTLPPPPLSSSHSSLLLLTPPPFQECSPGPARPLSALSHLTPSKNLADAYSKTA